MHRNIGTADKIIRVLVGLAILVMGIALKSWWGVIGVVPVLTAFVGICPAYLPFRISTCKTRVKAN
ncbi:MAG: DUF2892 domain-containing protein [candidate division Zixibacteria bacterium]|nr:DUF2892 domain-containing protein [candidate division Zixibacteria bacterium]